MILNDRYVQIECKLGDELSWYKLETYKIEDFSGKE